MVIQILDAIFCIIVVLAYPFVCWLLIRQHDKERKEWKKERTKMRENFKESCAVWTEENLILKEEYKEELTKERAEWQIERSKLLDRIQSGGLSEYKAQERADTPIIRREKDPLVAKLESEPWL